MTAPDALEAPASGAPGALPTLPDPQVAADAARRWALSDARLGGMLAAGLSLDRALLRWGGELLRGGHAADAVTALRAATALAPDDAPAWTSLGVAFLRTVNEDPTANDAAAACLLRSVTLAREQPDAWLLLGMARERRGELAAAESDYRLALSLSPSGAASAPALKCLGSLLARRREPDGAIAALREYRRVGPGDPAASALLGRLLYEEGFLPEALEAYEEASAAEPGNEAFARMKRRSRFLVDLIAGADVDTALTTFQGAGMEGRPGAAATDADVDALLDLACGALTGFGHHAAALEVATRRVALFPGSASARYLLASLRGEAMPDRSPDDYIVENYDAFAAHFEDKLVGVLGYDVPAKLVPLVIEAAARVPATAGRVDVLDGGCGTGLCAPLLRPIARTLTGVDLSPGMLERARARGLYDALACEELTAFLRRCPAGFDVVVATDVLIYFGDLVPLFDAAAGALRPSGLLAVSYESTGERDASPPADPAGADGRRLRPSGRFAHDPGYVTAVAARAFSVEVHVPTTLRREGREQVEGRLLVLRRGP